MNVLVDIVSGALMLVGAVFVLLACLGLLRFDDLFSRVHSATKAITFGMALAMVGAALQLTQAVDIVRLLLAVALQLVSAPVSSHIVARAAYHAGTELSPLTSVDELVDHDEQVDPRVE